MSITAPKASSVPPRLLAALHRCGISREALCDLYDLEHETLARALAQPPEPLRVEDMEFLRDDGFRYELWKGKLRRMSPAKPRHGKTTGAILMHLGGYLLQHPIGSLYAGEAGFRVGPDESLYSPDAAYISSEREATLDLDEFAVWAPDIAIEVWSPKNTENEMEEKAAHYLAARIGSPRRRRFCAEEGVPPRGARLVWLLRSQDRTIRVHRPNTPVQILHAEDHLSGEDVLPGFSVRVGDLFP